MDRYWESGAGQQRAFQQRQLRVARAIVSQEPRRKGPAGRAEAIAFRAEVRRQIKHVPGWPHPRAALAVDLHFHTSERQPPQLWNLPKHYLDLLGRSHAPDADPGPLLYNDDRSVKMLYASSHHGWEPGAKSHPSIAVLARSRADALADMTLSAQLAAKGLESRLGWRDECQADDIDISREEVHTANWLEKRGDEESRHAADLMRHRIRERHQDQLLHGNDSILTTVFLDNAHRLLTGKDPVARRVARRATDVGITELPLLNENDQITFARRMLAGLNPLVLPPLPAAPGDGSRFRADVDRICADYVAGHPGLFPLLVPLRVTVLVVPPQRDSRNQKDLDNVLIAVLAAVDRHLKPPLAPWVLGPMIRVGATGAGPDLHEWQRRGIARARSLGTTAIWAYQVLELARTDEDSPSGQVLLVLGHGMNHESLWREAEHHLVDYTDSADAFDP